MSPGQTREQTARMERAGVAGRSCCREGRTALRTAAHFSVGVSGSLSAGQEASTHTVPDTGLGGGEEALGGGGRSVGAGVKAAGDSAGLLQQ